MSERLNKTSICSIIFLDIIGYSQEPVAEQIALKERFNRITAEALKDVAQNDRIILDTGDGAAITLMGAPEEALFIALTIRDGLLADNTQHSDSPLLVRIGINLGPVRVVRDINNHLNVIGDGINVAQRVMSFAEPNQILVSRSYYEIVSRLSKEITQMFSYSGIKQDKHVREHEVYIIRAPGEDEAATATQSAATAAGAGSVAGLSRLSRKTLLAGAAGLVVVLAAVLLWPQHKDVPPPIEGAAQPAVMPAPADKAMTKPAAVNNATEAAPVSKSIAANAKDAVRKPRAKDKPAPAKQETREPTSGSKTAEHAAESNREAESHSAAPVHEPSQGKVQEGNKSGWDSFVDSVKKGNDKPVCSDAQRMMGQCR